ncbi:hypothetical protein COLO4_26230 [Corchorus olitorius]|uniref:Pentatricopeptide repeat-containing protein n=1 Tax=Corchorus olitorius TaxID=93759 RepID=A0A1R3HY12_9ROSI|nr:hypothetical protein COLO4_26230 [Corchorus olitorius]
MENMMIPCTSKPPVIIPTKLGNSTEFSQFPTKLTFSNTRKTHNPKLSDTYLNYLSRNGRLTEALSALDSIAQSGSQVRPSTFINLLQACIGLGSLDLGRKLHARIHLVEENDPFVETKLVSMYAKCGSLADARKVFDRMNGRNIYAWSAMIGLAQNGRKWQALCLFKEMFLAGIKPNGVTITSAVSAAASLRVLNMGREIHSVALKMGVIDNVLVGNSLIDMYAKCGELEAARQVFDKIEEKDVYSWNSMIAGYCHAAYCGKAYELFMKMQESDVKPNAITWNSMISGYIQNGDEDRAMDLFQRMERDGKAEKYIRIIIMVGFPLRKKRKKKPVVSIVKNLH